MNLNDVVNSQMKELSESGAIQDMVKDALEKTIKSAIDDQFCRYNSPIKEQLEEAIKESIKIDLSTVSLSEFTGFLNDHAVKRLREVISEESNQRLINEVNELLSPLPSEINIHDFIQTIINYWNSEEDKYDWESYYDVELKQGEGVLRNSYSLEIKVSSSNRYSSPEKCCNIYMIEKDGGHQVRLNHSMNINPTCLHDDAEQYIYRAYCQSLSITGCSDFDEHKLDLEVECSEYY